MSDDWNPRNPRWWTDQNPLVAMEAAKGYYLLQLIKLTMVLAVIALPFVSAAWCAGLL